MLTHDQKLKKDYKEWGIEVLPEYFDEYLKMEKFFKSVYGAEYLEWLKNELK